MACSPLLCEESTSNNKAGRNGTNNGTWPPDDILRIALHQYAKERLPLDRRLGRLQDQYGLKIGKSTLKKLNNRFEVPSARKADKSEASAQLVCDELSKDRNRCRGPGTIMTNLAIRGIPLPRAFVREVVHANDPGGADMRYPGKKKPSIQRGHLTADGPWHQVHCDGHEKMGAQALDMGGVALDIYAYRDKWSGCLLYARVVPNARLANTIGHLYLDFISQLKAIPTMLVFDKGSETGKQAHFQEHLKNIYCTDPASRELEAHVALPSTRNIVIEGLWHWFRDNSGRNLVDCIKDGEADYMFIPNNQLHANLFRWLWPPIIQKQLDEFQEYWNSHRVRYQEAKKMPSGSTPLDIYTSPHVYGGEQKAIPVPIEEVEALQTELEGSYDDAFRWVDDDFTVQADAAYAQIGSPTLTPLSAWYVFRQMEDVLWGNV